MKIALCCNDTRGGVEPYAILGGELRALGHDVTLIAPIDFAPMAEQAGLRFSGLSGTQREVADIAASISDKGPLAAITVTLGEMQRRVGGWAREMCDGAEGADLLVGGVGGMVTGLPVAARLNRPFVQAHLQPVGVRSGAMNGILFGSLPQWIGPHMRRVSQSVSDALVTAQFASAGRIARKAFGAARSQRQIRPTRSLFGFSPHVVPDTQTAGIATGYWHRPPTDWQPPTALAQFLNTDRPVIVFGFGSIASRDPRAMLQLVGDTAAQAGCRIVYLSGWTAEVAAEPPPDVLLMRDVPHAWLLPRVRAIVHHGGAGTTGAAFAAGTPQVIVPFGVDQPFWASRVEALGTGPRHLPKRQLAAPALAARLAAIFDGAYGSRARTLSERLASETGARTAARLLTEYRFVA